MPSTKKPARKSTPRVPTAFEMAARLEAAIRRTGLSTGSHLTKRSAAAVIGPDETLPNGRMSIAYQAYMQPYDVGGRWDCGYPEPKIGPIPDGAARKVTALWEVCRATVRSWGVDVRKIRTELPAVAKLLHRATALINQEYRPFNKREIDWVRSDRNQ